MDTGLIYTIGATLFGVVIWAVRLEGRVNTSEALVKRIEEGMREIVRELRALRAEIHDAARYNSDEE